MLPSSGCSASPSPSRGGQVVGLGEDAHLELGIKDFVNRVLINVPSTLIIDSLLLTWMYLEPS